MKKNKILAEPLYAKLPMFGLAVYFALSVIIAFPTEPAIVGAAEYYISDSGRLVDYCVLSGEIVLFSISVILVLYFAGERIFPDKPLKPPLFTNKGIRLPLIFLGVYVVWAIFSSVFSEYGYVSWWGFPTESEGLAAVIAYIIVFLSAYNSFFCENAKNALRIAVYGACLFIAVLTLVEIFFRPVTAILFGTEDYRAGSALLFGNSSNCGIVCAVLLPAAFSLCLSEEKLFRRIIFALLSGMVFLCVIRTYSSAALYTTLLSMAVLSAVVLIKRIVTFKQWVIAAAVSIVPVLIFGAFDSDSLNSYINSELTNARAYNPKGSFALTDIEIDGSELVLTGENGKVSLVLDNGSVEFLENGSPVEAVETENGLVPKIDRYSMIAAKAENGLLTLDMGYADVIYFEITDDIFQYISFNGYIDEITKPAFPELSEYYSFGTGRGYIWLSTLPLIKDCVFKGYGAGEFAFYYPQNDVVGSLNTHGTASILTTKPHCMYLQMLTSYGFPSLVGFLCAVVFILKKGICCKNVITIGLTVSVGAFLMMGLVNDSSPAVSGWFWFFSGVLLSFAEKEAASAKMA